MAQKLLLSRYRVLERAGAGGSGTVFSAWDTRIQRRVAIKRIELPDSLAADLFESENPLEDETLARKIPGLEETRTAALLAHPGIVGIHDFEVSAGSAFLIMDYVDGVSLRTLLRDAPGSLNADMVAAIFFSVAQALAYAHENKVLHLDIKPENILIDRSGSVRVVDFGLARLSNAAGFDRAAGGTIGYMPPEQMRLEKLDERTDVWALGSVLYEMLSGDNPFRAHDIPQALRAIEDAEIVLPSLCMEGIDEDLDDVLFFALDPDREERYRDVAAFAAAARGCLGDPDRAKRPLARLVGSLCDGEDDADDGWEGEADDADAGSTAAAAALDAAGRQLGRLVRDPRKALVRAVCAAANGAVAFWYLGAVGPFMALDSPFRWGACALAVLLGAVLPPIGALSTFGMLAALFLAKGFAGCAALCLMAGALWWLGAGHASWGASAVPGAALLGGPVFASCLAPLSASLLRPIRAAASSLAAALLLVAATALTEAHALSWTALPFGTVYPADCDLRLASLLTQPLTWAIVGTWTAAAFTGALIGGTGRNPSRGRRAFGVAVSGLMLAGGFLLWTASVSGEGAGAAGEGAAAAVAGAASAGALPAILADPVTLGALGGWAVAAFLCVLLFPEPIASSGEGDREGDEGEFADEGERLEDIVPF